MRKAKVSELRKTRGSKRKASRQGHGDVSAELGGAQPRTRR